MFCFVYPQYYYNSVTQLYMFWDSSKSTYLPAPAGAEQETQAPPAAPSETNQEDDNQSEGRKDKNKMAKKVG